MSAFSSSVTTTTFERWFKESSERWNDIDQTNEIVQTYIIRRLDDTVVNYNGNDLNLMFVEGVIPGIGDSYFAWDASSQLGVWQALARCRTVDFQTIDATGRCQVTIMWSTMASADPNTITWYDTLPTPPTIKLFLPATLEYQASIRSTRIYRTGATAPTLVSASSPYAPIDVTTTDIGGTTVKDFKNGVETEVAQTRIRLRIMRDATVAKMADQWNIVKDYIGKIHAPTTTGSGANFFNFVPGSIICEGVSMSKLDHEYYEVVFDFLWDEYGFNDQVIGSFEPDGTPKLNATGTAIDRVDWQRRTRSAVDFNNIFSSEPDLKAYIERGYWAI